MVGRRDLNSGPLVPQTAPVAARRMAGVWCEVDVLPANRALRGPNRASLHVVVSEVWATNGQPGSPRPRELVRSSPGRTTDLSLRTRTRRGSCATGDGKLETIGVRLWLCARVMENLPGADSRNPSDADDPFSELW